MSSPHYKLAQNYFSTGINETRESLVFGTKASFNAVYVLVLSAPGYTICKELVGHIYNIKALSDTATGVAGAVSWLTSFGANTPPPPSTVYETVVNNVYDYVFKNPSKVFWGTIAATNIVLPVLSSLIKGKSETPEDNKEVQGRIDNIRSISEKIKARFSSEEIESLDLNEEELAIIEGKVDLPKSNSFFSWSNCTSAAKWVATKAVDAVMNIPLVQLPINTVSSVYHGFKAGGNFAYAALELTQGVLEDMGYISPVHYEEIEQQLSGDDDSYVIIEP